MMLNKKTTTILLPPEKAEAFLVSDNQITYNNRIHREEFFSERAHFPLKTLLPYSGRGDNSLITSEMFFSDFPGVKHIVLVNPLIFQPQNLFKDISLINEGECPSVWTLKSTHSLALGSTGGFAVDHLAMGEMRLSKVNDEVSQSDLNGVIKDIMTCPELNPQLETEADSIINLIEEIVVKAGSLIPDDKVDQLISEIVQLASSSQNGVPSLESSLDCERLKSLVANSNYNSSDYQWLKRQLKQLQTSSDYTQDSSSIEYLLKSI